MTVMARLNPLISALPTTVDIGGTPVPVRTSYRRGISCSRVLDARVDQAPALVVETLLPDLPPSADPIAALKAAIWWLSCGVEVRAGRGGKRVWDWDQDADAVIADFQRYYGIDLTRDKTMHWWHFRALFDNLPGVQAGPSGLLTGSECALRRAYRQPVPSGASKQMKALWRDMARRYALTEEVDDE